jgi:zinc protease
VNCLDLQVDCICIGWLHSICFSEAVFSMEAGVKFQQRAILSVVALLWFAGGINQLAFASDGQTVGIPFPMVKRDTLLNGLQLMTIEKAGSGQVTLRVRVNSGAVFDLAGKGGLADLTSSMLMQGGGNYNAATLKNTLEGLNLNLRIIAGWDAVNVEISGPADATEIMFDVLGSILITPTFDAKELDNMKAQRLAAFKAEKSDREAAQRKALEIVFGTNPFGRPLQGTSESIQQITKADLLYFHKKFFLASNAVLVASGDLTAEQVTKYSRAKLGAWKKGDKVAPMFRPPDPATARRIVIIDKVDSQEAQATIAQVGISRRAQNYFPVIILNEILKAKLARIQGGKVELDATPHIISSPFMIHITAPPAEMGRVLGEGLATLTQLQDNAPSVELLEAAKATVTSRFSQQLQANPADALLDIELYGLGRDYLVNYMDRVSALTPADVQRAAREVWQPQTSTIVVSGPAKLFDTELKKLGGVTIASEAAMLK